ncbi:MAG: ATP-binding cassette domain-containing protein [Desulfobacteraceae bacterium]|nr:ATP-binding cassette domain-containing protein [Desulfobacteraceae bacterium]
MPLLDVKNLTTRFDTYDGEVCAVNAINLSIEKGECIGVVGESGSGKTQVFLSIMGLLAKNGKSEGKVEFQGRQILGINTKELNKIRGVHMSMIFQDPMTSLNPYLRISRQMTEVLVEHKGYNKRKAQQRAIEMLKLVGFSEAEKRFHMYPHMYSGGMRQRAMIAMSLLCQPALLIADEPTTALDVTVQAQILELMARLGNQFNMATVLITHDLGVIAGLCDRVIVMYAGRIVEQAPVRDLFNTPEHPYTQGLLCSIARIDSDDSKLNTIIGQPPDLQALAPGCAFYPRCGYSMDICRCELPELAAIDPNRKKACHLEKLR